MKILPLIIEYSLCPGNVFILDFKNDFAIDANFTERAGLMRVFATIDGLPFNPLIPFPIVNPRTGALIVQLPMHIAGVASVLTEQCDLGPQQHVSLKNAITSSFKSLGFSVEGFTGASDGMRFPDLSDVGEILSEQNVGAYNRLYPLFTLGLFKEEYRNKPFHSLINSSLVLDFSLIPSNQIKNALSQLVVLSAHNYYNTQPQSGVIRQVLVLDEAHRVLRLDFMPNFIRECRAYGVSTVLSSQYPSDFAPDISSAMATKILHSNGPDVNRVRAIVQMLGCEGQEEEVASLDRFQVLMDNRHYPHTMMRTMNYPLYLIWSYLLKAKKATRGELSGIHGLDTSKLPLDNLVRQLENFGYAEERGGYVYLYEKDAQA